MKRNLCLGAGFRSLAVVTCISSMVSLLSAAPLVVQSDLVLPEETVATYDSVTVSDGATLTVGGGSELTVEGLVEVAGDSQIVFASKDTSATEEGNWIGKGSVMNASSISVESGSSIHADGQGYGSTNGPGGSPTNGIGAAHGGVGSSSSSPVYGSMREPTELGSGSGVYVSSVAGGGAIRLVVSGTLTVGGRISSNGKVLSGGNHSGATGGSIWITTHTLAGTGVIEANASNGYNQDSGGGRVAVYFEEVDTFDFTSVAASGGEKAQDGTVYLLNTSTERGALVVSGRTRIQQDETVSFETISVMEGGKLELAGGSSVSADFILVENGGEIIAEGKNIAEQVEGEWIGEGVTITADSLHVETGGAITADGQGYRTGKGPGGGINNGYGASHGGLADGVNESSIKAAYGSMRQPTALGSAGGVYASSTFGGGALRIDVSDTLLVNGEISADGTANGSNHSGASGGSIWVTTGTLAGNGAISVDASVKGASGGNNGSSGGRVAIFFSDASGFDLSKVTAASGSAEAQRGTVYLYNESVANGEIEIHSRLRIEPEEELRYGTISVEPDGVLEIGGGSELTVDSLVVKNQGRVIAEAINITTLVEEEWTGKGITVNAATIDVQAGGVFSADGEGYVSGRGPGGGSNNGFGGSHGGRANGSSSENGLMREPLELGSAGGIYASETNGGGAIRMNVSDTITVDGILSANGMASGTNHSGAAGGSIWVDTVTLSGSGSISADASSSGVSGANGASSGGRVALYFDALNEFDLSKVTAASGSEVAQRGTVYLYDRSIANGELTVFSRLRIQENETVTYGNVVVESTGSLEMGGGSELNVDLLRIKSGGELIAESRDSSEQVDGVWQGAGVFVKANDLDIEQGAAFTADGQGYLNGGGPGGGSNSGIGASHGGLADGATANQIKPAYGSMRQPQDLGSSGGVYYSTARGGGAIRIEVEDTLTLNGTLSANGVSSGTNHSGAAGGSIWIVTELLEGQGAISSDAAPSGAAGSNAGSSGGRIAVYFSDASGFADLANITASGEGDAQDGTVYLRDQDAEEGGITLYGRLRIEEGEVESFSTLRLEPGALLELGGGSSLKVGDMVVKSGATVLAEATKIGSGEGVLIEATNLAIENGATLSADGMGFTNGGGPGGGNNSSIGGSYGGMGGIGDPEYGNPFEPSEIGSAGGAYYSSVAAGGSIQLIVDETFTFNGTITANGLATGTNHSGASGGSIWVSAGNLVGAGTFHADASERGSASSNNDSSGGRIAVYYENGDEYTGILSSTAAAGGDRAEDGTALFIDTSLANGAVTLVERLGFGAESFHRLGSLTLTNAARLDIEGGSILVVDGALVVEDESFVDVRSIDNAEKVDGEWIGRGSMIVADRFELSEDSTISADGRGYFSGRGPGVDGASVSSGASYGGAGAGDSGPLYGEAEAPVELGSAAGVYYSNTFAGGAIQIVVSGVATVDGTITANGLATGTNHSGATGGSIWISAASLAGTGTITANASGKGVAGNNVNSAGGRIAISTIEPIVEFPIGNLSVAAGGEDAEAGTIRYVSNTGLRWLESPKPLVHGTVSVSWLTLGMSEGDEVSLILKSRSGAESLVTTQSLLEFVTVDTTLLQNGSYQLVLEHRASDGELRNALERDIAIDNSLIWHGGTLSQDEFWDAETIHVVEDDVMVPEGVTLTIAPGAIVKFLPGTKLVVQSGGDIGGEATPTRPIVLTSLFDDEVGGDTNRDGSRSSPGPNDWTFTLEAGSQFNLNLYTQYKYTTRAVSGSLSGSIRWLGNTVYNLEDGVTLKAGSTLQIDAGAIVKMGEKAEFNCESGSRLIVNGTALNPVIFTSIKDDQNGGDSNGDGTETEPQAGDWRWLYFSSATAQINHAQILYGSGTTSGSWSQTGVIRTSGNSNLELRNSLVAEGVFDGILAWGGPVILENCVVQGFDRGISAHPGSPVQIKHNTILGNRIGVLMHGGALDISNSIITENSGYGLIRDLGSQSIQSRNTIYWNPTASESEIAGFSSEIIGVNGNVNIDPMIVLDTWGNYPPMAGSPAIDGADGSEGLDTDFWGYLRFDDPVYGNSGTALANGEFADIGAFEFIENASADADLELVSVTAPDSLTGGDVVEVSYVVRNNGTDTAYGPWFDRIYLSTGRSSKRLQVLASEVLQFEGDALEPGESREISQRVAVPSADIGSYFVEVSVNHRRSILEASRENNVRFAGTPSSYQVRELILGESAEGTFDEQGGVYVFKLVSAIDRIVRVNASTSDQMANVQLYSGNGYSPQRDRFDRSGQTIDQPQTNMSLQIKAGQVYYIGIGATGLASTRGFSIVVTDAPFALASVEPSVVGNRGNATLTVSGSNLNDGDVYRLVGPSGNVAAVTINVLDYATVLATFDCRNIATGRYSLQAVRAEEVRTLNNAVEVKALEGGAIEYKVEGPTLLRAGRKAKVTVRYTNTSLNDVTAPLVRLTAQNAEMKKKGSVYGVGPRFGVGAAAPGSASDYAELFAGGAKLAVSEFGFGFNLARATGFPDPVIDRVFLATAESDPIGVLPPGYSGKMTLEVLPSQSASYADFIVSELIAEQNMSWSEILSDSRPELVSDSTWNRVLGNLNAASGKYESPLDANETLQAREIQNQLADAASYLGSLGQPTGDVSLLVGYEVNKAAGSGELFHRDHFGPFGWGSLPLVARATLSEETDDQSASVVIERLFSDRRSFYKSSTDGVFRAEGADEATVQVDGEFVTLTEPDGSQATYLKSGLLKYLDSGIGRRVTLNYNSEGRVIESISSSGKYQKIDYNASGTISSIEIETGEVTTYSYDGTGEYLTKVTFADGQTLEMSYDLDSSSPSYRALISITDETGLSLGYAYDAFGRTEGVSFGGINDFLEVAYGDQTDYRVTRTDGEVIEFRADAYGRLVEVLNQNGDGARFDLSEKGDLLRIELKDTGDEFVFRYDDDGHLVTGVDPAGFVSKMQFSEEFELPELYEDSNGQTLTFEYENGGERSNLERVVYPDGTSEQYEYDAFGRVVKETDAKGQEFLTRWNNMSFLERIDFPDGTFFDAEYGEMAGLPEALVVGDGESSEATLLEYDDRLNLTRIEYPNGRWIEYGYDDSSRRISMDTSSGLEQSYSYDSFGRLSSIASGDTDPVVSYEYDDMGRLTRIVRANGTKTVYGYELLGRISRIEHLNASDTIIEFYDIDFDDRGNVSKITSSEGELLSRYDANGRLLSAQMPNGDSFEYEYDGHGNWLSRTENGARVDFEVNAMNQYTRVGESELAYDANGNLVSFDDGSIESTFEYDSLDRLVKKTQGSDVTEFEYDALGALRAIVRDGEREEFLVDPVGLGNVVSVFNGTGTLHSHVLNGLGVEGTLDDGDDPNFFLFDQSDSLRSTVDGDGSVVAAYGFSPYGMKTEGGGANERFGFASRLGVFEVDEDLVYMRARFYSKKLGRFVSRDPGLPPTYNPYEYAFNDPMMYVDPNGMEGQGSSSMGSSFANMLGSGSNLLGTGLDGSGAVADRIIQNSQQAIDDKVAASRGQKYRKNGKFKKMMKNTKMNHSKLVGKANLLKGLGAGFNIYGAGAQYKDEISDSYDSWNNATDGWSKFAAGSEMIGDSARGVFKVGTSHLPLAGIAYDVVEWGADQGSRRVFNFGWEKYYEPDPSDVFADDRWRERNKKRIRIGRSFDPNDKATIGTGELGYIYGDEEILYRIRFENLATAALAAQEVVIEDVLDAGLDLNTLRLVDLGFDDYEVEYNQASQFSDLVIPIDENHAVKVQVFVDPGTRTLTWYLHSIDPETDDFPEDPTIGFLPPNDATGRGEGYVHFAITPREGLNTNDTITNQASIVFDLNKPIETNVVTNTIDRDAPTSSMESLEGEQFDTFIVSWDGEDLGSGISGYDIYYSVDEEPYQLWLSDDSRKSWVFSGELGRTYNFYSVAHDNSGLFETKSEASELTVIPTLEGANYLSWANVVFEEAVLNDPAKEADVWGVEADPDNDGLNNALEFYAASNPWEADAGLVFSQSVVDGVLVLKLRQSENASAVLLAVEGSYDLIYWDEAIVQILTRVQDDETWIEAHLPLSEDGAAFIRLGAIL